MVTEVESRLAQKQKWPYWSEVQRGKAAEFVRAYRDLVSNDLPSSVEQIVFLPGSLVFAI